MAKDFLSYILQQSLDNINKPVKYAPNVLDVMAAADVNDEQARRARDSGSLATQLREEMSSLGDSPTLEELQSKQLNAYSKYGDPEDYSKLITNKYQLERQAEIEDRNDRRDSRMSFRTIADIASKDPDLAKRYRDMSGMEDISDSDIESLYKSTRKSSSSSTKALYDENNNPGFYANDQEKRDLIERGYKYPSPSRKQSGGGISIDSLNKAIDDLETGGGKDMTAREQVGAKQNNAIQGASKTNQKIEGFNSIPRAPLSGYTWKKSQSTGKFYEVPIK